MQKGRASILFEDPPRIIGQASVVGKKESEGPLGTKFDQVIEDDLAGQDCWEMAESTMQIKAAELAMEKAGLKKSDIRYLFSGDLLGQLIATSFGTGSAGNPAVWTLWSLFHHGRSHESGGHDSSWGIWRPCTCHGVQPFRHGGERVPFSPGLWQSEAVFRHLDSDGVRGSGDREGCERKIRQSSGTGKYQQKRGGHDPRHHHRPCH